MKLEIRIARLGLAHGERLSDALCESLAAEIEFRVEEEREAILQIVKGEEEHGEHNRIGEYACAARAIEGKIRARGGR
jgi:hypothetical protein